MITWEMPHASLTFLGLQRNVTFISGPTIWEVTCSLDSARFGKSY
jgi:hypothetical protein